jgi:hypothetical protein
MSVVELTETAAELAAIRADLDRLEQEHQELCDRADRLRDA